MAWHWLAQGAGLTPGEAAELGLDRRFDDQQSAEAWLTNNYVDLADVGVHTVTLYEEDRLVYGPMSLEP